MFKKQHLFFEGLNQKSISCQLFYTLHSVHSPQAAGGSNDLFGTYGLGGAKSFHSLGGDTPIRGDPVFLGGTSTSQVEKNCPSNFSYNIETPFFFSLVDSNFISKILKNENEFSEGKFPKTTDDASLLSIQCNVFNAMSLLIREAIRMFSLNINK